MAAAYTVTNLPSLNSSNSNRISKSQLPSSLKPSFSEVPSWLRSSTANFTNFSLHFSTRRRHVSINQPISATVLSILPTAHPDRFGSAEEVPKWSWRAIKAFAMAQLEARKLKYANTGPEALLLGILVEGTSVASKYLWKNGITVFKVREETIKILGKADMYFFPPERPPLTDSAQRALDLAVDHKLKSGDDGEVTTSDLLLGIWSDVESPGHKILANLGFDDDKAMELESLSAGPKFMEG